MNTFKWLLKREYWEHRGGFFWAPIVTGLVFLVMSAMAIVAGESVRRSVDDDRGERITMNGVELERLTQTLSPQEKLELAGGLDLGTLLAGTWPYIALAFVVFFYCLGALFDDRKDRSILFWKSLPLSDARTVGSKVVSALVVAPVIATIAAVATSLGFLVLLSAYVAYHGGNPVNLIWGPASPLTVAFHLFASLPVYAVWALPTVGWLLLVSAWAKGKPFLWALLVPILAGILVTWFEIMKVFGLQAEWFWQHVVGRLLLGTVPGMEIVFLADKDPALQNFNPDGPHEIMQLFTAGHAWQAFGHPEIWIGAAAGIAMIFAAIWFRKTRDEG